MVSLFKRRILRRINEILNQFERNDIEFVSEDVNFFGIQSRKKRQVRGNGTLILTKNLLFFEMWWPKRQFSIEIKQIEGLEIVKSFLGKTRFKPLLKVKFLDVSGIQNSMAFLVPNLEEWKRRLEESIKKAKSL